ncbi:hypothetical protein DFH94DRAFT_683935 [Russula ochroleuca]|uniref:Uncharacterized protein n=1 Tax=Russula ochroleuca TaxID=152965 RepID=A0A9P5K1R0_9AGAM|nr:hypothetical protein DFH94DRAFT_683935 [Russula ochroleuca]
MPLHRRLSLLFCTTSKARWTFSAVVPLDAHEPMTLRRSFSAASLSRHSVYYWMQGVFSTSPLTAWAPRPSYQNIHPRTYILPPPAASYGPHTPFGYFTSLGDQYSSPTSQGQERVLPWVLRLVDERFGLWLTTTNVECHSSWPSRIYIGSYARTPLVVPILSLSLSLSPSWEPSSVPLETHSAVSGDLHDSIFISSITFFAAIPFSTRRQQQDGNDPARRQRITGSSFTSTPRRPLLSLLLELVSASHHLAEQWRYTTRKEVAQLYRLPLSTPPLETGNYSIPNSAGIRFKRARPTPSSRTPSLKTAHSSTPNSARVEFDWARPAPQLYRLGSRHRPLKTGDYSALNSTGVCFKRARPSPCVTFPRASRVILPSLRVSPTSDSPSGTHHISGGSCAPLLAPSPPRCYRPCVTRDFRPAGWWVGLGEHPNLQAACIKPRASSRVHQPSMVYFQDEKPSIVVCWTRHIRRFGNVDDLYS